MAQSTLKLTVKVAWWLRWYLLGVLLMARMTGLSPDDAKLRYWIGRAITVKLVG